MNQDYKKDQYLWEKESPIFIITKTNHYQFQFPHSCLSLSTIVHGKAEDISH